MKTNIQYLIYSEENGLYTNSLLIGNLSCVHIIIHMFRYMIKNSLSYTVHNKKNRFLEHYCAMKRENTLPELKIKIKVADMVD